MESEIYLEACENKGADAVLCIYCHTIILLYPHGVAYMLRFGYTMSPLGSDVKGLPSCW